MASRSRLGERTKGPQAKQRTWSKRKDNQRLFKSTISKKESNPFLEKAKPRVVNIKVLRPSKCSFKALEEDHATLTLEENLDLSQETSFYD